MDTSLDQTRFHHPQHAHKSSLAMSTGTSSMTRPGQPSRRLLIFQEARNPQNTAEIAYLPVNKLGLPICGEGPVLPDILELPLRIVKAFTEIFNQPKYKGWSVRSAGPYHDTSEEGKFYAVVLEQTQGHQEMSSSAGSP